MTENSKMVSVAAIASGTVIDHIQATKALQIVRTLDLAASKKRVAIGLNLPSGSMQVKDLIKVEDRILTDQEIDQVAVISPSATINIIENFQLVKKFQVQMPKEIRGWLACPNPTCITHVESLPARFQVLVGKKVELRCLFCERRFSHDTL